MPKGIGRTPRVGVLPELQGFRSREVRELEGFKNLQVGNSWPVEHIVVDVHAKSGDRVEVALTNDDALVLGRSSASGVLCSRIRVELGRTGLPPKPEGMAWWFAGWSRVRQRVDTRYLDPSGPQKWNVGSRGPRV